MDNLLEAIDKYKFGLIAALAAYVAIFIYLQVMSYEELVVIEAFQTGSYVEVPEEDIHLQPENIMVPSDFSDVKNITRDANDDRERSYDDYVTSNMTQEEIDAYYDNLEKEMYDDAGGEKTREEIRKEMEERKKAAMDAADKNDPPPVTDGGGDKIYKGSVMVDWKLDDRTPHLNKQLVCA